MSFDLQFRVGVMLAAFGVSGCSGLAGAPPTAPGFAPQARQPVPPGATTVSWANYGFSAGQSGFNNLETTLSPSNVGSLTGLWQSPGSYVSGVTGIVEHGGSVYINDFDGKIGSDAVQAINAKSGVVLWTKGITGGGRGTVAFGDGLVFTNGDTNDVCAYRSRNGAQVWCVHGNPSKVGAIENGPSYANGVVYFSIEGRASVQDELWAVDAKTGSVRWVDNGGSFLFDDEDPPAVSNGRVYNYCSGQEGSKPDMGVCAYDASSGSPIWMSILSTNTNNAGINLIVGHNGVIYYSVHVNAGSVNTNDVGAINTSGSQLWGKTFTVSGGGESPFGIATDDKKLYAQVNDPGSYNPEGFYAFKVTSGKQSWHVTPSSGTFASTPAVANGVIYTMDATGGGAGGVLALAASNGVTLFNTPSGFGDGAGARPIVVNATVYAPCGDSSGGICAWGLGAKKRE